MWMVQQQIKIAAGELPFTQEDITFKGHAIECRLNVENHLKASVLLQEKHSYTQPCWWYGR